MLPATWSFAEAEHSSAGSLKWKVMLEVSGGSPVAVNQPSDGRRAVGFRVGWVGVFIHHDLHPREAACVVED